MAQDLFDNAADQVEAFEYLKHEKKCFSLYNRYLLAMPYDLTADIFVQGELFIIDVSQAVDLDHPRALDFLREDAAHVNTFFRRAGIATLTTRELFEFVVDPNINAGNVDAAIDRLSQLAATRETCSSNEDQTADNVRSHTKCFDAYIKNSSGNASNAI